MATKKNTTVKSKSGTEYEYFRITRTIGHKYVNGKKTPIRKAFYGTSKKNAEKNYEEWREEQREKEKAVVLDTRPFGELLEYYCENILMVNSKYQITTRVRYKQAYERLIKNSAIIDMPMNEVVGEHIQTLYNSLSVSKSTMTHVHCFLTGFFKWGMLNNISDNILKTVVVPDTVTKRNVNNKNDDTIVIWTDEEINTILTAEPEYELLPLIIFALYSGMRISELLGLKWSDIYDDVIHVRRQFCMGYWKNPKRNEKRDIPVHKKIKECMKYMDHSCELVFHSHNNTPYQYESIIRQLSSFYKRINIPCKKFHAYRATFCTNLCKKGVQLQITAKLAGHKSIEVTAQYYAAVSVDDKKDAISKL